MKPSERIKSQVSLRQVAEAAGAVWDLKKSRQAKGDWWAPCPLHGEATASFHIQEAGGTGGLFKCFGCHAGGSVIDFVMAMDSCDFTTAVRRLVDENGLSEPLSEERQAQVRADRAAAQDRAATATAAQADAGHARALRLWRDARVRSGAYHGSSRDTGWDAILPRYLARRGVKLAAIGGVPPTLRIAGRLDHWVGGYVSGSAPDHTGPAMVAAIGRGKIVGVHRTWITPHGRANLADGSKVSKQWMGRTGEMMGQPCVLSRPAPRVVAGEGIETTLSAFSALVADGQSGWSAEAGLSRGAITGPAQDAANLWTPRPGTAEVLLLGEGSSRRAREARELYEGAQARLEGLGLTVRLVVPHGRWDIDADFADVALAEGRG